jgi:hypothetical protein
MITRLDPNLRLTLIEHMAHLTSRDYGEIPRDLLLLGFIPPAKADLIEDSGLVELLASIYGQWTAGGGAASVNVNDVIQQLQDLTATRGNLFQIPPYFAYIAKSFSVLEGIGLSNDPKYSIINSCLPYVSQRLLTDSDTMGPALSTFVFGSEKSNLDTRFVQYRRVEQLVQGFSNYATSSSGAMIGKENASRTERLEMAAEQILDLVYTEKATPLQDILLEQIAKIVLATSRSVFSEALERSGTLPSGRTVLGTIVDPLGLWRTSAFVRVDDRDRKTIETTRKLIALVQNQLESSNDSTFDLSNLAAEEVLALASILGRNVWSRRMGVIQTSNRFAQKLLSLAVKRLEQGERVSIPRPVSMTSKTGNPTTTINPSRLETNSMLRESERLMNARYRLAALEAQNEMDDDSVVDVPVELVTR